jgi:hypothetical protein
MNTTQMNAQNKTFRFEARTPNGKWFVCGRNVSAVEADAYAKKYLNDPNFRVVPELQPQSLQTFFSTRMYDF